MAFLFIKIQIQINKILSTYNRTLTMQVMLSAQNSELILNIKLQRKVISLNKSCSPKNKDE